jgi:hypothetical protein
MDGGVGGSWKEVKVEPLLEENDAEVFTPE